MTQCVIIAPKRSGHNLTKSMLLSWRPDLSVKDLENFRPNQFPDLYKKLPKDTIYVLQTRDLLSWASSVIRQHANHRRLSHQRMLAASMHWYRISREFYRETEFTECTPVIRIVYDRFVCERVYRQKICAAINGIYTEDALQKIPDSGGGSSFNGFTCDGNAQAMNVLDRHLELTDREIKFLKVLWQVPGLIPFYRRHMHPAAGKVQFLRMTHKIIV